jgi:integrase/ribosomal protein L40E
MAINQVCSRCRSLHSLRAMACKKCGFMFGTRRKYKVVVYGVNGKRTTKVLDDLHRARKYESKLKTQATENELFGITEVPLIDEVWGKYMSWAKQNKKSWRDDEQRWTRHIQPHLKGRKMNTISAYDVEKVTSQMRSKREYAPATIKQVIVLVKRLYNWAAGMELYRGENPASRIKLPKINNEVTECLTRDEIDRLLVTLNRWWNKRVAMLVEFAVLTGLRRGELFALKWADVDLENGWIFLRGTKGGKDTQLPISDRALGILRKAKALVSAHGCPNVFPNRHGDQRTTLGHSWTRIKKAAGISPGFRFHGLRHTFASYLASSGKVSQYTLQKLLTHKTPQMTQRYAHLFDQTLRDGVNLLPELI